jgi:hypothetical protein
MVSLMEGILYILTIDCPSLYSTLGKFAVPAGAVQQCPRSWEMDFKLNE